MRHSQTLYLASVLGAAALSLSACSTVKLPNLDVMQGSAFSEDVKTIDMSVPDVSEAPQVPNDVRSTAAWDMSARELIIVRDAYEKPFEDMSGPEDLEAEFESLKAKAQAYKLDDPIDLNDPID